MSDLLPALFTDATGDTWPLRITAGLADELRDNWKLNVWRLGDGKIFMEIANEPEKMLGALWSLCEAQIGVRELTHQGFKSRIGPEQLAPAIDAVHEAIVNFTPPLQRAAARAALERTRQMIDQVQASQVDVVNSDEATALIEREISKATAEAKRKLTRAGSP